MKICGIYKIENLFSGKTYIGQSKDIEARVKSHFNCREDSIIDNAIFEEGRESFGYQVLEICDESMLDSLEDYYIQMYHSNDPGFGYNVVRGGQHNIGESNSNCKLTEFDVFNIREAYKNHERKHDVYEKYKYKVSWYYFSNLWEGVSWKHVHYDVYTEENINYYKRGTSLGENGAFSVFTNEEVLQIRTRYINESAREIYEDYKDRCSYQSLQCILWGRFYKDVPVYNKKKKEWNI